MGRLTDMMQQAWERERTELQKKYPDYSSFTHEYDNKEDMFRKCLHVAVQFENIVEKETKTYSIEELDYVVKEARMRVANKFQSAVEDVYEEVRRENSKEGK